MDIVKRYYLFSFLRGVHFFSAVLVPFFTDWGHISLFEIQLLQSWYMLWIFLLEVPTGAIADYFGRKYSLALGALMWVFGALIYGSIPHFGIFLLGEFVFAMSAALMSGADKALIYDLLKERKREFQSKTVFGNAHALGLLGMLITAPIGSIIASSFGLNWPILLSAIPALFTTFVALSLPEAKVVKTVHERTRYLLVVKEGFQFFYSHRVLRLLALDGIIVATAAYFIIWFYQPLLTQIGIPIIYFGFIHALLVGSEIMVSSNFSFLEKLFGSSKNLLRVSALITAAVFALAAFMPNPLTALLFIMLGAGFGHTRLEFITTYMQSHIPSNKRATVLSSISMFRRMGLILFNPLMGFLAAHFSLQVALLLLAILPITIFFFSPIEQEMLE